MQVKLSLTFVAAALSVSTYVQPVAASLGMATRYWDCCMPSGAWHGKASVYKPVDVCEADGVTLIPSDKANQGKSGCDGGDQFACTCMQPFNDMKDETLGYGFSAFAAAGQQESDNECSCYEAHFNSKDADGKPLAVNKLIFQVINSGSDVHTDNFDFAIPGGGLGSFEQGCPNQWHNSVTSWGQQMGGVTSAQECKNIPESLQSGCSWRFKYWGNNPTLAKELKRVRCTKGLIDRSGCQRKDDAQQPVYSGITDAKGQPAPDQYKRDRSVCTAPAGYSSNTGSGKGSNGASGSNGGDGGYGNGSGSGSGNGGAGYSNGGVSYTVGNGAGVGSGSGSGSGSGTGTGTGSGTGSGTGTGTGSGSGSGSGGSGYSSTTNPDSDPLPGTAPATPKRDCKSKQLNRRRR